MIGRQTSIEPSLALLAALEKLETLRKQARAERDAFGDPGVASKRLAPVARPAAVKPTVTELGQLLLVECRRREAIAQGPSASDAPRYRDLASLAMTRALFFYTTGRHILSRRRSDDQRRPRRRRAPRSRPRARSGSCLEPARSVPRARAEHRTRTPGSTPTSTRCA